MTVDTANLGGDLWSHRNLPDIVWYCDPDKVLHFYNVVVEHEKDTETGIINTLPDLFDVDLCPSKYLPYLADMVGLRLDMTDREETWRAQIRTAVRWYKEKGKLSSFNFVLYTMGMHADIFPLWIDEQGNVDRYPHNASWKPHARIDIELWNNVEWRRYLPEKVQYVFKRLEEVRPIHVLIRSLILGWELFDNYPVELIHDADEDTLIGDISDEWDGVYFASCGIWHFRVPNPNILRDGGGYDWFYPSALDILNTPPVSPANPSRYLVGISPTGAFAGHANEIADWDGAAWVFTSPIPNQAIWVLKDPQPVGEGDPGGWQAYNFTELSEWVPHWTLYEFPRHSPGPFFRECAGALNGQVGPIDLLDAIIRHDPVPDTFSYCMFHDALEPSPVHGGIQIRDGAFMRNCGEVADDLEIDIVPATTNIWDTPVTWDSPIAWD